MKSAITTLALVGLAILFFFTVRWGVPHIEGDLNTRCNIALAEQDYGWASATADGRAVILAGYAPSEEHREQAAGLVAGLPGVRKVVDKVEIREIRRRDPVALCQEQVRSLLETRRIQFETASAAIESRSSGLLQEILEILESCPDANIQIGGHTDATGSQKTNLELSQKRAESVKAYMIDHGIDADRLSAVGYGPSKPIASNSSESGRRKNRRIEFILWGQ